jgi:uncharacterized repeat protein (TIGR03803 family)
VCSWITIGKPDPDPRPYDPAEPSVTGIPYSVPGIGIGPSLVTGVVVDAAGHLFGAALYDGQNGYGTIYELSPK